MSLSRRQLLTALSGVGVFAPSVATAHRRRVDQHELDTAIEQHARWLSDRHQGRRASFAGCDLSGLDFHRDNPDLVDLRGADFSETDMTGVTGNLVSFRRASLHYARLSWSGLIEPAFIDASLRGATCHDVTWGRNTQQPATAAIAADGGAVMYNCDAGQSDFARAIIRGHFFQTSFIAASLVDADFSYSTFTGPPSCESSFFAADLTRAKFRFADIASARFRRATLASCDFTHADISCRVTIPRS